MSLSEQNKKQTKKANPKNLKTKEKEKYIYSYEVCGLIEVTLIIFLY